MADLEKEWYKNWFNSPYYHLLYEERDEKEAAKFIDQLIHHLKPSPGSNMLDIACGKGRHSILLAAKGYPITGIDISPQSIADAQKSATDKLDFFIHDMRMPFRINYYDYAFNFFTSFGYFDSEAEHIKAIHNMALALKPNGILVIDYLNPVYTAQNLLPNSEVQKGNIHFSIQRWSDNKYFYKKITITDKNKESPISYLEKVANFSIGDFKKMFRLNHLSVEEVFGNYQLDNYSPEHSPRMIFVTKKLPQL